MFLIAKRIISFLSKDFADKGQLESNDYGCAMLYGVIRNFAYKISGYAFFNILQMKQKNSFLRIQ